MFFYFVLLCNIYVFTITTLREGDREGEGGREYAVVFKSKREEVLRGKDKGR